MIRPLHMALGLTLLAAGAVASEAPAGILEEGRRTAAAETSLQATLVITSRGRGPESIERAPVLLLKPNYGRVVVNDGDLTCQSDGKRCWVVSRAARTYEQHASGAHFQPLSALGGPGVTPLTAFMNPDQLTFRPGDRLLGTRTIGGRTYQVVQWGRRGFLQRPRLLFFGPGGMLEGMELTGATGGPYRFWLEDLRPGVSAAPGDFAFQPPADYAQQQERSPAPGRSVPVSLDLDLLDGGQFRLRDALAKSRAVLLDFWFVRCSGCRAQMPLLSQLTHELSARGVPVVAVNTIDGAPQVRTFVKEARPGLRIAVASGAVGLRLQKTFGVKSYPDTFLIGKGGRILWRGSIADEASLIVALQQLGINE